MARDLGETRGRASFDSSDRGFVTTSGVNPNRVAEEPELMLLFHPESMHLAYLRHGRPGLTKP